MSDRPIIEAGREGEILALVAPHAPGGELPGGARLKDVSIEARRVRITASGRNGGIGALVLLHPDDATAPAGSRPLSPTKSFVVLVEAGAEGDALRALETLRDAIARNDDGTFWRGAARAVEPPSPPAPGARGGWVLLVATLAAGLVLLASRRLRTSPPFTSPHLTWSGPARPLAVALGASGLVMAWTLRSVETDDAYAVLRHAQNLIEHGELSYNLGERICAFTSPLHTLLMAGLGALTGELVVTNRLLGVACSLGTLSLLERSMRRAGASSTWQAASLIAVSPYFLHWTFGGLETPLLGVLVTGLAVLCPRVESSPRTALGAGALAGLALATRLDAVVFVAPLLGATALRLRGAWRVWPLLVAAAPPLAWAAFARSYYGDALPTSFYVKTPHLGDARWLLENTLYTAEFLVFSGLALVAGAATLRAPGRLQEVVRAFGPLWLGLAGVVAYGLVAATTHLFYAFRLFVPYLGPASFTLGLLWAREEEDARPRAGLVAAVLALQWSSFASLVLPGGNLGGARVGEMRDVGAPDASAWVRLFAEAAEPIRRDWASRAPSATRPLRLATVAQGSLPFALRGATVHERHAAYRHRCRPSVLELAAASDYVALVTPYPGEVTHSSAAWELVFQAERSLGGIVRRYRVFYNPSPNTPSLPPRIDQPCRPASPGAAPG